MRTGGIGRDGAAVHLLQHPGAGQRVQVAADRHVRDVQPAGELVDPYAAAPPHLVQDQGPALFGQQVAVVRHVRARLSVNGTSR